MRQIKPRAVPPMTSGRNQNGRDANLGDASHMSSYRIGTIATLIAIAATAALSTSPALAFSSEAQQMCSDDAMRLCASEVPDIPRITACMVRNKSHVSPGCRAVMDREAAAAAAARKREAAAQ